MTVCGDQIWAPYTYLEKIPGKGMRSLHIEAFNAVLQAPAEAVERVKRLVQQLHTASLLMDDVEDGAILRRGRPAAHSIFGIPRTINTASFAMLSALHEGAKEFPDSIDILFKETIALHEGQSLDLYWRDTHTCPTECEYKQMVIAKTGGLYRLAVKLLQAESPTNYDLVPVADCFGLIYQIQDDLLNLKSDVYMHNKGFAEDITEGKYSFPVIHCLSQANNASLAELQNILMQHTNDVELKQHALRILEESGSLKYSEQVIQTEFTRAIDLIENSGVENPAPLLSLLHRLVEPTLGVKTQA